MWNSSVFPYDVKCVIHIVEQQQYNLLVHIHILSNVTNVLSGWLFISHKLIAECCRVSYTCVDLLPESSRQCRRIRSKYYWMALVPSPSTVNHRSSLKEVHVHVYQTFLDTLFSRSLNMILHCWQLLIRDCQICMSSWLNKSFEWNDFVKPCVQNGFYFLSC